MGALNGRSRVFVEQGAASGHLASGADCVHRRCATNGLSLTFTRHQQVAGRLARHLPQRLSQPHSPRLTLPHHQTFAPRFPERLSRRRFPRRLCRPLVPALTQRLPPRRPQRLPRRLPRLLSRGVGCARESGVSCERERGVAVGVPSCLACFGSQSFQRQGTVAVDCKQGTRSAHPTPPERTHTPSCPRTSSPVRKPTARAPCRPLQRSPVRKPTARAPCRPVQCFFASFFIRSHPPCHASARAATGAVRTPAALPCPNGRRLGRRSRPCHPPAVSPADERRGERRRCHPPAVSPADERRGERRRRDGAQPAGCGLPLDAASVHAAPHARDDAHPHHRRSRHRTHHRTRRRKRRRCGASCSAGRRHACHLVRRHAKGRRRRRCTYGSSA